VDDGLFANALGRLNARLAFQKSAKNFASVVLLAEAALKQMPQRLTPKQIQSLKKILNEARGKLQKLDAERVAKLVGRLGVADETVRKSAAAELQAMGERAVKPLLGQLRKIVAAEKDKRPNIETEKAILAILQKVAPKLLGYDVTAAKDERLKILEKWSGKN